MKKEEEKERKETLFKCLVVLALEYLFSVFTRRHDGHVGVQNNSKRQSSTTVCIMQNLSAILPLLCTPTWPSHYVSENQEMETM